MRPEQQLTNFLFRGSPLFRIRSELLDGFKEVDSQLRSVVHIIAKNKWRWQSWNTRKPTKTSSSFTSSYYWCSSSTSNKDHAILADLVALAGHRVCVFAYSRSYYYQFTALNRLKPEWRKCVAVKHSLLFLFHRRSAKANPNGTPRTRNTGWKTANEGSSIFVSLRGWAHVFMCEQTFSSMSCWSPPPRCSTQNAQYKSTLVRRTWWILMNVVEPRGSMKDPTRASPHPRRGALLRTNLSRWCWWWRNRVRWWQHQWRRRRAKQAVELVLWVHIQLGCSSRLLDGRYGGVMEDFQLY